MVNEKGNTLIIGVFIGLLVAVGLFGAYYLGTQKSNVNSLTQLSSKTTSDSNDLDLNGFPVFPNATFVEEKDYPPCQEGMYSGFSICNSKSYTWNVKANNDDITTFYSEDKTNSGWVCGGGAGSYDDTNNASGKTSCKKEALYYGLIINTSNGNSQITLVIPKGNPADK